MAELADSTMIEPIRASVLLNLEGGCAHWQEANSDQVFPVASQKGIWVKGLDKRFARLWNGGRVVGIGSPDEGEGKWLGKTSLPLYLLGAALLNSGDANRASSSSNLPALPDVYIIAPHTSQTIPILHAHLANTMSNSQAAIELLQPVRLLQYFDLAGLAESVAEVSERVYRDSQRHEVQREPEHCNGGRVKGIVLIQGIGQTVSATHRRSGLVQANTLLASLSRNITQLSRSSSDVLVLLEFSARVEEANDRQENQDSARPRVFRSMELESAFSGPRDQNLRLPCGHETLSRTLESGLDCVVVVHDAFGRVGESGRPNDLQEQVIEVIKDRFGDLTGLWDIWKEG